MDHSQNGEQDGSTPPFELKDILYAVLRSKIWIGFFGFVGLCWGVYSAASKPNEYTSSAKLHLRLGARESFTTEDLVGSQSSSLDRRAGIEDEIHMLTAQSLYEKLAKDIGPQDILKPADPKRHSTAKASLPKRLFHELQARILKTEDAPEPPNPEAPVNESQIRRAAIKLMKSTRIHGEQGSNVISVFYKSTSAKKAQMHLSVILDTFLERHLDQYSMTHNAEVAQAKMEQAGQVHSDAQAEYFAHLFECNRPDADEALSGAEEDQRLLKGEIFKLKGRRDDIKHEINARRKRLDSMPETISVTKPAVTRPNEERETALQVKSRYLSKREELQFENILITDRNERQKFYDERIAELEKEIEGMERLIVEQEETLEELPNEDREVVEREREDLETEDEILVTSIERLEERLEELEEEEANMLDCKFKHLTLISDMEDKQRVYEGHASTYDEAAALASIDLTKKTNLTILEPASLPSNKSGPSRGKIILMGIMGGVMFAGALAVLRQLLDSKVRYPHVADRALGIPVIAVPERRALRALRKAPRSEVTQVPQVTGAG